MMLANNAYIFIQRNKDLHMHTLRGLEAIISNGLSIIQRRQYLLFTDEFLLLEVLSYMEVVL